jgi:hypothetical protein
VGQPNANPHPTTTSFTHSLDHSHRAPYNPKNPKPRNSKTTHRSSCTAATTRAAAAPEEAAPFAAAECAQMPLNEQLLLVVKLVLLRPSYWTVCLAVPCLPAQARAMRPSIHPPMCPSIQPSIHPSLTGTCGWRGWPGNHAPGSPSPPATHTHTHTHNTRGIKMPVGGGEGSKSVSVSQKKARKEGG